MSFVNFYNKILLYTDEFEGSSSSYTRDFPEGKNSLPGENVVQVSSKHNEYQVSFIYKVTVPR